MSKDHPPIHSPAGVEYWDEDIQDYIMDPSPPPNTRPTTPRVLEPWMKQPEPKSE